MDVVRGKDCDSFVMVTGLLEEAEEGASTVKGSEDHKPPEKPKTEQM